MTLKKLMEKLKKEKFDGNVYIGGANGSSFFYIGPYDKKILQKIYDERDKEIRKHSAELNSQLNLMLREGFAKRVSYEKEADLKTFNTRMKELENKKFKTEEDKAKAIRKLEKMCLRDDISIELHIVDQLNSLAYKIRVYEDYKKNYKKNIEDVEVADYYDKSDLDEPGKIIIIKGCQRGGLWLVSESPYAGDVKEA